MAHAAEGSEGAPGPERILREAAAQVERGRYLNALAMLRQGVQADPDPRLRAMAADIQDLVDHLRSRDTFAQAYEDDYATKKEVHSWWKRWERWCRTVTGRRTRKLIRKTVAFPRFLAMERRILEAGARHILDVGCHDGAFAISLGGRNPTLRITGIDITAIAIREARALNRCPNVTFEQMFAEDLPDRFPDRPFDLAIISHTLEHVIDVAPVIEAVERVVREDGLVFIAVPAGGEAALSRAIVRDGLGFRKTGLVHHVRSFTRDSLVELFGNRPGFVIERVRAAGQSAAPDEGGPSEYFVTFRVGTPSPSPARRDA